MTLPTDFQFSQGSLQDFADCPRRFQLRYIEQRDWPAAQAEPALENEQYLQRGARFHHMVHQSLLGVPAEKLTQAAADDQDLAQWWQNFLAHSPDLCAYEQYPEAGLAAPLGEYRLVAKYDLIAIRLADAPGDSEAPRAIIYDWKTSRKQPQRAWLIEKLQTRVYPHLLARAGSQLNEGQSLSPEQIQMTYWFSNFPQQPAHIPYSQEQYHQDESYLLALIEEIQALDEETAPLTEDERRCRFCVYRSLCDRGVEAGPLEEIEGFDEPEQELDLELDFEAIDEIIY